MNTKDYDPFEEMRKASEEYRRLRKEESYETPKHQTCLHKLCGECHGSGNNRNGGMCLHMISCPCSNCSPTMMVQQNKELLQIN